MTSFDLPSTRWRKSTHSGGQGGNCVEVGSADGMVGIRDSKALTAGHLTLTRTTAATLLAHIKTL
ncbi:DUF397 domain-containing protein [Actinomadura atramentaria]|uniref:DUF397 domain-containing protein n=1 Tax=Actinomadura atramentaria TaxID=1990 RepID=UPI00036127EF|nr:DUF397 domain-containing protein [Actinomadura atramentaria]